MSILTTKNNHAIIVQTLHCAEMLNKNLTYDEARNFRNRVDQKELRLVLLTGPFIRIKLLLEACFYMNSRYSHGLNARYRCTNLHKFSYSQPCWTRCALILITTVRCFLNSRPSSSFVNISACGSAADTHVTDKCPCRNLSQIN
jgi:hypothetical protein